jgi:hypothetical protein
MVKSLIVNNNSSNPNSNLTENQHYTSTNISNQNIQHNIPNDKKIIMK